MLHFSLKCFGGRCSFWSWLLKIRKDLSRMAYFCLIYIYISLFFFFWYILLWIPASLELIFLSLKKEFTLSVFLFVLFRNHQILEKVETITLWKNNLRTHRMDFAEFSRAIRNWWEKHFPWGKVYHKMWIWWKKSIYTLGKNAPPPVFPL